MREREERRGERGEEERRERNMANFDDFITFKKLKINYIPTFLSHTHTSSHFISFCVFLLQNVIHRVRHGPHRLPCIVTAVQKARDVIYLGVDVIYRRR